MAERLGSAVLELSTDDRKLRRGLGEAERRTDKTIGKLKAAFAGLVTVGAVMGLARAFGRVIDRLDGIAKAADKLGLTTEALQEMRFAAELSGVAVTTFDMAFQRFTRRAGEAAAGTGEAKDALRELGFTIDDLQKKSPEELFMQAAKALAETEDAAERLRLAFKLFDSEGVAVVNMVANLEALRDEARKLGVVLADDLVRDAVKMKDEMTRVIAALDALFSTFVIKTMRGLDAIFNVIPDSLGEQLAKKQLELSRLKGMAELFSGPLGPGADFEAEAARQKPITDRIGALNEEIAVIEKLIDARDKASQIATTPVRGGGAGGGAETVDRFQKILDAMEREIGLLDMRFAALQKNTREAVEFVALTEAMNEARRAGLVLTEDQIEQLRIWARDMGAAAQRLDDLTAAMEEAEDAAHEFEGRVRDVTDDITGPFRDAMVRGELSFRSFADTLLSIGFNLRDRLINEVFNNLEDAIARLATGGGQAGGGSIFGSILGALGGAIGGLFGGGGSAAFPANTGQVTGFAHGGSFTVGGRSGVDRNLVQFAATRGERVTVTPNGGAGTGGGVEVNVYAPPGSEVEQSRSRNGDLEILNVMIDQAVAKNLRAGTATFRAMKQTFGARQQLTNR